MHNALNRLQTSFGFFTTCAFTLAAIIALLAVIPVPNPSSSPTATITARNVQVVKGRPHYYSSKREEYAQIRFDLDADLSSLFTWNTKQVFVYVTANYPGSIKDGVPVGMTKSVIWDTIIPATQTPFSWQSLKAQYWPEKSRKLSAKSKSKSKQTSTGKSPTDLTLPGVLSFKNQKPKYHINDPSGILSEKKNVTLQVSWNVQPWVGALLWDDGYLGKRVGTWAPGKTGRSEVFDFPPLKGPKVETVKNKDGPQMPQAGEAAPVVDV